jgi:hypothetical protein
MSETPDTSSTAPQIGGAFPFTPVPVRPRHDGWTHDRQEAFIEALAQTGCVEDAARAVGMSVSSAYALKCRTDAQPFRLAWGAALEVGIERLSDAALSRAIHGTAQPVFYKGELVGERRHYDERLTMFLLRYRDPARYGAWIDRAESIEQKPDAPALFLRRMLNRLTDWMHGFFEPAPRPGDAEEDENRDEEEEEEEDGGDGDSDDDEDGGDAEGAAHDAATIGEAGDEAEEDAQPRPCEDGRADWRGEGGHFPPEGDATPPASPVPRIRSL